MARLGVHHRYDPAPRDTARDAPASRHLGVGLDVLAGHHRQQRRRLSLILCEPRTLERVEHRLSVGDQLVDEPGPLVGVAPVTHRLGAAVVVMAQHQRGRPRRQLAHTPYLRADHRDRVLGPHRVIQHRGVQRPLRLVRQRPALSSHLAHRVEDPLRTPTGPQPLTPQRQHARIETLIVDAQTRRGLPAHITAQPLQRLAVRAPLQRLQHHHHRDHRTRHRRTAPRPEQIPEQPVGKQPQPVLGQEPIHRPLAHQSPAQPQRVQQLPIRSLNALHTRNSPTPPKRSRAPHPNYSAVS